VFIAEDGPVEAAAAVVSVFGAEADLTMVLALLLASAVAPEPARRQGTFVGGIKDDFSAVLCIYAIYLTSHSTFLVDTRLVVRIQLSQCVRCKNLELRTSKC
jgi:hypothetical protein